MAGSVRDTGVGEEATSTALFGGDGGGESREAMFLGGPVAAGEQSIVGSDDAYRVDCAGDAKLCGTASDISGEAGMNGFFEELAKEVVEVDSMALSDMCLFWLSCNGWETIL
jgi:hypothetical protein